MKRRLLKLAVFLLLGAVVNVAVAWGLAYSILYDSLMDGPTRRIGVFFSTANGPCWAFLCVKRFGSVGISAKNVNDKDVPTADWSYRPDLVPHWSRMRNRPRFTGESYQHRLMEDARGWPFLTLSCAYTSVVVVPGFKVVDGIEVKSHPDPSRATVRSIALPLEPIWPGFAINTIFYATILWPVILGPFALRRFIRRKRGLCVACGYDLRHAEHDACPECGAAILSPLRERARSPQATRRGEVRVR